MSTECWRATLNDLDTLVVLAREFHALSPFRDYKFSPSGTRQHFLLMMRCPSSVIIMHENGLIGGTVSDYPFCELRIGKEAFWYARRDGIVLLKEYMRWVEGKGGQIDLLSSLEIEGKKSGVIGRVLRRLGFDTVEHTHMRII